MSESTNLKDLPLDILVLIFPYLDAKSFLSLCSTCKAFQQPFIRLDPSYWSHATRSTFRVPNQPVVQADGLRWQRLYKRLLTQSRVFTWGSNTHNCLGHAPSVVHPRFRHPRQRIPPGAPLVPALHASFPTEMMGSRELGIIADLQCGGWSTTLLTSRGQLHSVGVLDGMQVRQGRTSGLRPLSFPPGHTQPSDNRYDPFTAIRQFSSGRYHILGISDSGRIWSWYDINQPSVNVKFIDISTRERGELAPSQANGLIRKVVAGWDKSSAYVNGVGIVLWDVLRRSRDEEQEQVDTMLVMESAVVPRTSYQRPKGNARDADEATFTLGQEVGEVVNWIMLEHTIVFVTDLKKAFATRFSWDNGVGSITEPIELTPLYPSPSITDVQGSFRSFAIFTQTGEILITDQDYLHASFEGRPLPPTKKIPALQNAGVISLAFGDYHYHALHSSGHITSYGRESQSCGALGLGGDGDPEGQLRGIRYQLPWRDGDLVRHCYTTGRRVWFEREKRAWVKFLASGGKDPGEAAERMRLWQTEVGVMGEVSEWVEQRGRDWDKRADVQHADEDGLGAYFALSVAAAGWHSGALVLVNEGLAERVRDACIVEDTSSTQTVEDDAAPEEEERGFVASTIQAVNNWARWFLGLPSSADPPLYQPQLPGPADILQPENHGASPGKGFKYVWAEDPFPRLRLSDGREMPGEVEFAEWRDGRPEWVLDIEI